MIKENILQLYLDETLVHYIEEGHLSYVKVRNGTENFIQQISKFYEIIIFTASTSNYCDYILNHI